MKSVSNTKLQQVWTCFEILSNCSCLGDQLQRGK